MSERHLLSTYIFSESILPMANKPLAPHFLKEFPHSVGALEGMQYFPHDPKHFVTITRDIMDR